MGRTESSKDRHSRNTNEGTSARTRAFSFEDIMLRRNKKEKSTTYGKSSKKNYSTVDVVKEPTFKKGRDDIEHKHISAYDVGTGMKIKSVLVKECRDDEKYSEDYREEKYIHYSDKHGKFKVTESEKVDGKKRSNEFEETDNYDVHYMKHKRDRKGHYYNDDKKQTNSDSNKYKKHDSIKYRDMKNQKYSEKKVHKKHHFDSIHEDSMSRRRRSRSLDHNQKAMSSSLSPLSRKHAHREKDYGDIYKDNSKQKPLDDDRYQTSGNDGFSSGHQRKRGSGLGGYSPRKRKTEAAVKTPSPRIRSPERKSATWDQLPTGISIAGFPLDANKVSEAVPFVAVTPVLVKTHSATSINLSSVVMNASIDSVQLTQANRPMRRLYIEKLPSSATEKALIDCLNNYLVSFGANRIRTTRPCISCIINKDKAQGLAEFLTPEDATAALSFDGNSFDGSVLRMRRPKDYADAASGISEKTRDVVKAVSDVVMDSPNKIFVGGISDILSSKMLMEIVSAFGPLKAYYFSFNKDLNGPCAFLEYEDHSITSKACAGINGLMLGGSFLTAVRAFPDFNGMEECTITTPPSYAIPPHAKPLLAHITQVLGIQNIIPENFNALSENELEEILEDVRLECARFGTVKAVQLVRNSSTDANKSRDSELSDSINTIMSDSINTSIVSDFNVEMHLETNAETLAPITAEIFEIVKQDCTIKEDDDKIEEETRPDEDASVPIEVTHDEAHADVLFSVIPASIETADPISADKIEDDGNRDKKIVVERDFESLGEEASVHEAFARPGCILVEFQRKEAACIAAQCLHGRSYGEHIVIVEYVPHDLYQKIIFSK